MPDERRRQLVVTQDRQPKRLPQFAANRERGGLRPVRTRWAGDALAWVLPLGWGSVWT